MSNLFSFLTSPFVSQSLRLRRRRNRPWNVEALEERIVLSAFINAGGPAVTVGSTVFEADSTSAPSEFVNAGATGNKTFSTNHAINLSHASIPVGTPQSLFQTERWDPAGPAEMQWDFPVTAGEYEVRLYFAEIYEGAMSVGDRVFDVSIDGQLVLDNYDVFADVGGYAGVVKTFQVTSDGNLDIDFGHVSENPNIKAIEIRPLAPQPNQLGISGTSLDFGEVAPGGSATRSLTLTNQGGAGDPSITVNGATISGAGAAQFESSLSGPVTLDPGESVTIDVTYSPTAAGDHQAVIAINHSGSNTPSQVQLSGASIDSSGWFINAGGPAVTVGSVIFEADSSGAPSEFVNAGATDNKTYSTSHAIDLSHASIPVGTPQSLFQTERWDPSGSAEMQWDFSVLAGEYEVRLYFAEIYSGAQSVGARVFDVLIEGQLVLDNYDVFADVGGYAGVVKTFQVTSDGNLDIDFGHVADNPAIKAIEIRPLAPQPNQLGISGTSLTFGNVSPGGSTTRTLTLTNRGTAGDPAITVNGATISGADAALFESSLSGPVTLNPGESVTIDVTYSPTAAGDHQAVIAINHSGSNAPTQVELNGTSGAVAIGFGKSILAGAHPESPTSLQFGPDGRLYVASQSGLLYVYTIERNGPNNYSVTATEIISSIQAIPNHDDDGSLNPNVTERLVTGLLVAGTASNPVIYVTSSDPRIGAGPNGGDLNLDTNSGILSRLTWDGSQWVKLDLVRGLPRSEENHTANGMQLDAATNTLYIAQGGNTNMGAPSDNFADLPEYALSAAVLSVDLDAIGESTYDLPTLDDEDDIGADDNDPFGGNDGKNQAMLVPGGPVQVYAPGFRNPYDLVLTASGRLYTIDNGSNQGWGDVPVDENGNETTPATSGEATNQSNEPGVTDPDNLHLVTEGFYGGHPNPTRANTDNTFNSSDPQSPVSVGNPIEGTYLPVGSGDGALAVFSQSTNGLTEYTASNFGGALQGDLLTASFSDQIFRIQLSADGTSVTLQEALFNNVGSTPLDVTAVGDNGLFPGTIWTGDFIAGNIIVFEPNDFEPGGGPVDPNDLDGDGYSNEDEAANGTDPGSAADFPPDHDTDHVSNLLDPDDDNDGLGDTSDPFAIDSQNGRGTPAAVLYNWENDGSNPGGLLNLGFTGLMTNGVSDYEDLYDPGQLTAGGAAGVLTIDSVSEGDATGASNTQEQAFQFGVDVTSASGPVTAHTRVLAPFSGITPQAGQQAGLFIGMGDQDNYVRIVIDGNGSVRVISEINGVVSIGPAHNISIPGLEAVDFYLTVDPLAATVQAAYALTSGGALGTIVALGNPLSVPSSWWADANGLAVGIISTSAGPAPTFSATWDFLEVTSQTTPGTSSWFVNAGGPALTAGSTTIEADSSSAPSEFVNAGATGNKTFSTNHAINLSHASIPVGTPQSLFQTERWDPAGPAEMQWDFPVTAGEYEVRLYFAEIYEGAMSVGDRVFDVSIEGQLVLDNYDVFADVGGYTGVVKTFQVTSDGNLDIDFGHVSENPNIKAIEIRPLAAQPNQLGISGTSLDFGEVAPGGSITRSLTLTNQGGAGDPSITVNGATISGAGAAQFESSLSGPVTLNPGESVTIDVTYSPTAVGDHQAVIAINHSGSNTATVALSGSSATQPAVVTQAFVEIDSGSGIDSSTYNSDSFQIQNTSTSNAKITSIQFDLSSAILPDLVFDPNGGAGDLVSKGFTADSSGTAVGLANHTFLSPHDDGFDGLQITFNDFDPGETFSFSVDVDPTSIRGTSAPGPNESGSVSGLELAGSTITVTFDDGTTAVINPFRAPNSDGASQNTATSGTLPAPTIEVLGVTTTPATVSDPNQVIRVTGAPGTTVRLLIAEAGLYTSGLPNGGFDIDPFEANSLVQAGEATAVIGTEGYVDIPVTLTQSDPNGGIMHFVAVTVAPDGQTSRTSNVIVLDYEP